MAKKWGFEQYGKKVDVLLVLQKSGNFFNMAKKWGFCQYGKKVGVLLILQ
jgi:hypothetical protein